MELATAIQDRMVRGPAEFWVLVPATPTAHIIPDLGALSGAFPLDVGVQPTAEDVREEGVTTAKANLETELANLREVGAVAEGAVGDANPVAAIEKALGEQQFDEILLSTLPPGVSRWLALDLPSRVRRRCHLPLTVITAQR